jgi:F420-non-reducing hydrogenase iron-sulfur subunit
MGIEPERVQLVWASAAEGARLADEITKLVEVVRALGPLNCPRWQNEQAMFARAEHVEEAA